MCNTHKLDLCSIILSCLMFVKSFQGTSLLFKYKMKKRQGLLTLAQLSWFCLIKYKVS